MIRVLLLLALTAVACALKLNRCPTYWQNITDKNEYTDCFFYSYLENYLQNVIGLPPLHIPKPALIGISAFFRNYGLGETENSKKALSDHKMEINATYWEYAVSVRACTLGWSEKHIFWKVQSGNVSKAALWYQNTVYEI